MIYLHQIDLSPFFCPNYLILAENDSKKSDSIYFYSELDKENMKVFPLSDIKDYSYNENNEEQRIERLPNNRKSQIILDSGYYKNLDEYRLIHIEQAGISMKQSVVLRLVSTIPLTIAPFTVKQKQIINNSVPTYENDYTTSILLTAIGVGLNIASIAKMIEAGNHLEQAGKRTNNGLSFYFGFNQTGLRYKF
jgi:hypothetical protein